MYICKYVFTNFASRQDSTQERGHIYTTYDINRVFFPYSMHYLARLIEKRRSYDLYDTYVYTMYNQVASLCVQGPKGGSSVRSSLSAAVCLAADLGIKRFTPIYLRSI